MGQFERSADSHRAHSRCCGREFAEQFSEEAVSYFPWGGEEKYDDGEIHADQPAVYVCRRSLMVFAMVLRARIIAGQWVLATLTPSITCLPPSDWGWRRSNDRDCERQRHLCLRRDRFPQYIRPAGGYHHYQQFTGVSGQRPVLRSRSRQAPIRVSKVQTRPASDEVEAVLDVEWAGAVGSRCDHRSGRFAYDEQRTLVEILPPHISLTAQPRARIALWLCRLPSSATVMATCELELGTR